ncbi:hypothetical protein BURPS1106B_2863 [Burkholderia pseudomallei 1106b]|nr:hypothetical protein BURPS1106B_2863 [Burkholderia pseudomallei 1106b]
MNFSMIRQPDWRPAARAGKIEARIGALARAVSPPRA